MPVRATDTGRISFPSITAPTERDEKPRPLALPRERRVGFALVGLGRLTIEQLVPAFAKSRLARPVALVSGDRAKAMTVARTLGIEDSAVLDYRTFDRLAELPAVQVVYVVLPNSMHAEYTIRAARAGKHVLCEKPMANSVAECRQMIEACRRAGRKLMIAYRSQYEPMDRLIAWMARSGELGTLREFTAMNGQHQGGDLTQWRLKRALAGGGALVDVGIYGINAARFMSGEEPIEVLGHVYSTPGDPRFREVEETAHALLRFPSGLVAQCGSSYGTHESKFLRLSGALAWAELDPAFAYTGLKLRIGSVAKGRNQASEPAIDVGDQFAREIDHMARCIIDDVQPHTPGEEGLQDMRIIEAVYESASSGRLVSLQAPGQSTRGPEPHTDDVT
ncbi:MAG: Gfo/Idh/MocA family oxidoreductase [Rhizobacter sp.]|nr:Gfo/Idh/MocA family oxidoreductase [Rhizobacter sp.]